MKKIISSVMLFSFFSVSVTNCAEKLLKLRIEQYENNKLLIENVIPKTLYSNKERSYYLSEEKLPNGDINYYIPDNCDTPYYRDSILRIKPIKGNCKVILFGVYNISMLGSYFVSFKPGNFTESDIEFWDDKADITNINNKSNIVEIILRDPETRMTFGISANAKKLKESLSLFLKKFNEAEYIPIDDDPSFHLQALVISYKENSMYLIYEINGLQHYFRWDLLNLNIIRLFIECIDEISKRDYYLSIFGSKNEDNVNIKNNEKSVKDKSYSTDSTMSTTTSISNIKV